MVNKKGNAVIWVVVIIIVILALVWWGVASRDDNNDGTATTTSDGTPIVGAPGTTPGGTSSDDDDDASLEDDMIGEVIVTYTTQGFSPATVTINKGQTVRWVNQSGDDMWVASANHPTHTVYPGSDIKNCNSGADMFDQCHTEDSFEFTFNEVGEWGYHNHSQASHTGKVIVE